jgi:hypothetical protein
MLTAAYILATTAAVAEPPPWLLAAALTAAPPGQTAFSVMPAKPGLGRPSAFYGFNVVQEDAEHGTERYRRVLGDLAAVAAEFQRAPADGYKLSRLERSPELLMAAGLAIAVYESGLREDVQVGRGWAKKASDDGGRGRGPSGEACFMQIHPASVARFANGFDEAVTEAAERGDPKAREAMAQTLLGLDSASVQECWRTGLRMLVHAHRYCAWAAPKTDWDWASFAMYGTGHSCTSRKTMLRVRLFRKIAASRPRVSS